MIRLPILPTIIVAALVSLTSIRGSAQKYRILDSKGFVTADQMLEELAKADVVFVGEQHDHAVGHLLELEILKGIHTRKPRTLLSLEMFERDVQPVVDEYLAGLITESHFLLSSRPWPNYKTDYRPLVEFCRENELPVVAANAPRRYVNIVSRLGQAALAELPKASRANLGPISYPMDLPPGYDKMLNDLFGGTHGQGGTGQPAPMGGPSVDNIKQAQGLWDVTMADSVARALKSHHGWTVVQVNGAGHSDNRFGIVDRLQRRLPRLRVAVVSIRPDPAYLTAGADKVAGAADFLILTEPDAKK